MWLWWCGFGGVVVVVWLWLCGCGVVVVVWCGCGGMVWLWCCGVVVMVMLWRDCGGESGEGVLIFIPDFSMGTNKLIN